MYTILCVYFVAHELLLFKPQSFGCSLRRFNYPFDDFPFSSSCKKPMSDRSLHRDLATKPLEPTSIGVQLTYYPLFLHSLGVHHIYTSFVHGPVLRVPPMELSIPISIFSLFCSKISVYLGVMMFKQYGLGILILSLNQPLIPSLLPVTVHLVWAFPLVWIYSSPDKPNLIFLVIWCIFTDCFTDYLHYCF